LLDGLRRPLYPAHHILGVFDVKKLLLLSVLALAACTESRGVHSDWSEGAHFSPYGKAEFNARAARGEPGVFPAPSGYSVYAGKTVNQQGGPRVVQQGTASSRTGEFSGPGVARGGQVAPAAATTGGGNTTYTAETIPDWALPPGVKRSDVRVVQRGGNSLRNSPFRANALVAAKEARGKGQPINLGGQRMDVYHIDVGSSSYAVFRKRSGIGGGSYRLDASLGPDMVAALPSLTGCSSVAGPFRVGPGGRSNTHMVYALNCG